MATALPLPLLAPGTLTETTLLVLLLALLVPWPTCKYSAREPAAMVSIQAWAGAGQAASRLAPSSAPQQTLSLWLTIMMRPLCAAGARLNQRKSPLAGGGKAGYRVKFSRSQAGGLDAGDRVDQGITAV
jgi:hypothetical protein